MISFQTKVDILRQCESITYTICLRIVQHEAAASRAAEHVLKQLFQDADFWRLEEQSRIAYIFKRCVPVCASYSLRQGAAVMQA